MFGVGGRCTAMRTREERHGCLQGHPSLLQTSIPWLGGQSQALTLEVFPGWGRMATSVKFLCGFSPPTLIPAPSDKVGVGSLADFRQENKPCLEFHFLRARV